METLYDIQQVYVDTLIKAPRQFVNLPMGIGVAEIVREVALRKNRKLSVVCLRVMVYAREWGSATNVFTPDMITKGGVKFGKSDLVYIDIGVTGRQSFTAVANSLSNESDFIWRLI